MGSEQAGEPRETLHRGFEPDQRSNRCRNPAAAIGTDHDIPGEHHVQRGEVARSCRREEGACKPLAFLIPDLDDETVETASFPRRARVQARRERDWEPRSIVTKEVLGEISASVRPASVTLIFPFDCR